MFIIMINVSHRICGLITPLNILHTFVSLELCSTGGMEFSHFSSKLYK